MISEEIPAALGGERLDRIVSLLTDISRSDAALLVTAGGARIDGVVTTSGKVRVDVGQIVEIDPAKIPRRQLPVADDTIAIEVVHADDDVIVVDKPAGLVVHPGHGHPDGTLVNAILARYPEVAGIGDPMRPGIVHRLDVGTSGLMVVARSAVAYDTLVVALGARRVTRGYQALVWGHLESLNGVIDAPIGRDHKDPLRMAVVIDGKPARTRYHTITRFTRPTDVSHLECHLESGRTHQIRVHLSATGHPVIGDGAYGGIRSAVAAPRPFLHAAALGFRHPVSGQMLAFESALPDDLQAVLATLS